jgi:pimeloyl-ACP methyl ester carboxylesterase
MNTQTLQLDDVTLTYDVREAEGESERPPLLMIGSPMDASGFGSLAAHFGDRPVITYDPRGVSRSVRADTSTPSTPQDHAADLDAVIEAVGLGPVDLFASSGGAVNALALVERHPEQVRTLVAHEPPDVPVLPDREEAAAAIRDIHETYQREGLGPGMAKFIAIVQYQGPIPADYTEQPAPDPAAFGLPAEDDGSRDDPLLGQNLLTCTGYEFDFEALRSAPTRIVVAAGAESEGELAHRGALGVAERLGQDPVIFPSHHAGFLGGEFGQQGDPPAFAEALRAALD